MSVRKGGQEGAIAILWPAKIVCFSTFSKENSIFLGKYYVFAAPPLENFALPWKKVCGRPCARAVSCLS